VSTGSTSQLGKLGDFSWEFMGTHGDTVDGRNPAPAGMKAYEQWDKPPIRFY